MICLNIIIIDDDYLVVESLKTIVTSKGINLLAVGYDGNDAISLYKEHKPDVVLMDIRMKNLNGIDAARDYVGQT